MTEVENILEKEIKVVSNFNYKEILYIAISVIFNYYLLEFLQD